MHTSSSQAVPKAYGQKVSPDGLSFLGLLDPHWLSIWLGCLLVMLTSLIMVGMPVFINGGVSLIDNGRPFILKFWWLEFSFESIYQIIGAVAVLAVVGAIIRTSSRMVIFGVGRSVERTVRSELFSKLSVLDDRFYDKHSIGELMNHLTTDIVNIRLVTGFAVLNIMNILFVFFLTVPFLLKVDTLLALCALLPFPLVVIATSGISKRMFHATVQYQAQLGHLTNHVQENLLGAHVVRLFHQQQAEASRFQVTNKETYELGVKLARVRVLMMPVMRLVVGLSIGLVLYVGGLKVLSGEITLGQFVEVNARILQLAWPAMSVGFVMSIYSRGQASLLRVNQLFIYQPIIKDGEFKIDQINKIDVHDLVVSDTQKSGAEISFSVKRGGLLGIVGPSGSHKSRLLKTLYRRLSVPSGHIFFDGRDINDIELTSLYEQIAVVSQDSFLFHKSILENITFAKPQALIAEIDEVLRITRLDQDLLNFPEGINTIIGERGITLSGGQRQRVVLARAILTKKPVLILDDALSSVDAHTEEHILANLSSFKDSIVIVATHRLFALLKAQEILVMDKGRLVDRGTHQELLTKNALYQQLWGIDEQKERSLEQ